MSSPDLVDLLQRSLLAGIGLVIVCGIAGSIFGWICREKETEDPAREDRSNDSVNVLPRPIQMSSARRHSGTLYLIRKV